MNTPTNCGTVNHELTARLENKGIITPKIITGKRRTDKMSLIAIAVLTVIPAAVFALQALGVIHFSTY